MKIDLLLLLFMKAGKLLGEILSESNSKIKVQSNWLGEFPVL